MWTSNIFCNDAWLLVQEVVALKNKINQCPSILCKHCSHEVHEFASLACDHCLGLTSIGL